MIRATIMAVLLSATAVTAQTQTNKEEVICDDGVSAEDEACVGVGTDAAAAAAEGVTGFVPLVGPALGALGAAAGVAAAAGGGSATTTTSTVSTN